MPAPIIVVTGPAGVGKSTVAWLVAKAYDRSVHLPVDDIDRWKVNGWAPPASPEAAADHDLIGSVFVSAALQFAAAGVTAVVDGYLFADGARGFASACRANGAVLHYAVLCADLATCLARAEARGPVDRSAFEAVHARFGDLGDLDAHVVDGRGAPEQVAEAVLAGVDAGTLAMP